MSIFSGRVSPHEEGRTEIYHFFIIVREVGEEKKKKRVVLFGCFISMSHISFSLTSPRYHGWSEEEAKNITFDKQTLENEYKRSMKQGLMGTDMKQHFENLKKFIPKHRTWVMMHFGTVILVDHPVFEKHHTMVFDISKHQFPSHRVANVRDWVLENKMIEMYHDEFMSTRSKRDKDIYTKVLNYLDDVEYPYPGNPKSDRLHKQYNTLSCTLWGSSNLHFGTLSHEYWKPSFFKDTYINRQMSLDHIAADLFRYDWIFTRIEYIHYGEKKTQITKKNVEWEDWDKYCNSGRFKDLWEE